MAGLNVVEAIGGQQLVHNVVKTCFYYAMNTVVFIDVEFFYLVACCFIKTCR